MPSSLPRKQRKRAAQAPWHVKHKALAAHVDPELRKKYKGSLPRCLPLRKGDEVLIARGSFRGREGKIIGVDGPKGTATGAGGKVKKTGEEGGGRPLPP